MTITDVNACTKTQTVTLTQPPALTSSVSSQTNIACHGDSTGTATVTASGGTGKLSYLWTPYVDTTATATGLGAGTYTCTITDANSCTKTQTVTITEPGEIIATISAHTDVICNSGTNGSATITASGGTGTLTYSWAPSGGTAATALNLAAGTYTCTVTDTNACTKTQTVTITQPTAITSSMLSTPVTCFGGANGSATVTASGGTGTYTYSWAPSGGTAPTANGLVAGTYTCTITDANACTTTQTVSITQPAMLTATVTQIKATCYGVKTGGATVVPSGGTAPYKYLWTPNADTTATVNNLGIGDYTVTVMDANGCGVTKTQSITEYSKLVVTGTATLINCYGEQSTVNIAATGSTPPYVGTGTFLKYAGNYTFVVSDSNSCKDSVAINIAQPNEIVSSQNITICYGEKFIIGDSVYTTSGTYQNKLKAVNGCDSTVTTILTVAPAINTTITIGTDMLTAYDSTSNYQWLDCNNGNTPIPFAINRTFKPLVSGSYAVVVMQNTCKDTSECVPIVLTGITTNTVNNILNIFPNPSNGAFTIQATMPGNYSIVNELGQIVERIQLNTANNYTVFINNLSNGSYYITGLNDNQFVRQKIIILQP